MITTAELDAYVSNNLKAIAGVFPDLVASREAETARRQAEGPGRETRATPRPPELRLVVPARAAGASKPEGNP